MTGGPIVARFALRLERRLRPAVAGAHIDPWPTIAKPFQDRRPRAAAGWGTDVSTCRGRPEFSERMLREHLDQSHESIRARTIERQTVSPLEWLGIGPASLSLLASPAAGLVARGLRPPRILRHRARHRPRRDPPSMRSPPAAVHLHRIDVLKMPLPVAGFDARSTLYGQGGVARPEDHARS